MDLDFLNPVTPVKKTVAKVKKKVGRKKMNYVGNMITMPPEMWAKIDEYNKTHGLNRSSFLRLAAAKYINTEENN